MSFKGDKKKTATRMLSKQMEKHLAGLVEEWADSGIGLGEIIDRLSDLAARRRIVADEPNALDDDAVNPALRLGRDYRDAVDVDKIRDMHDAGLSYHQIGVRLGIPADTAWRYATRGVGAKRVRLDADEIRDLVFAGYSFEAIAAKLGCAVDTAKKYFNYGGPGSGDRLGRRAYEGYAGGEE